MAKTTAKSAPRKRSAKPSAKTKAAPKPKPAPKPKIKRPEYARIYHNCDDATERVELANVYWAEITSHLEEIGRTDRVQLAMADRYVRTRVEYTSLYPLAVHKGAVSKGPNGGEMYNMEWAALEKMNERMLKLEIALLVAPQASLGRVTPKAPKRKADAAARYGI